MSPRAITERTRLSNNGAAARRSSVTAEDVADPQVPERAQRRTFTAKYKLAILEEYERAERGERGAILRRENLYSSLLTEWRNQRDRGALEALSSRRGPRPGKAAASAADTEIVRLRAELDTAREVIRVQGELSALLERLSADSAATIESER
jgi:transposase